MIGIKLFDEWLDTHEPSYSSNPKVWMEEAFRAGMLAAADMVTDSARGFRLNREGVADKIREAAK